MVYSGVHVAPSLFPIPNRLNDLGLGLSSQVLDGFIPVSCRLSFVDLHRTSAWSLVSVYSFVIV